jgi:DNA-binding transcriptional MocR family regulator
MEDIEKRFARRMRDLRASDIREILKVTQRPEVISFAGGLPASELLPAPAMAEIARQVLLEDGVRALQYAPTEGLPVLREIIARRLREQSNMRAAPENVLVVSGSQQALDLTGKIFLDEGDAILCESPTYLGAINAFRAYQPRFVEIETDDNGMIPKDLERRLVETDRVKFVYVVPDFQNPSGRRWSLERRQILVDLATRFGVPVVEDSPYAELCFEGAPLASAASFDDTGIVMCLGTFSKLLAPGMRLGWVAAETSLIQKFVLAKQGADLHTSSLNQLLAARFISDHDFSGHIEQIRTVYRSRRNAMVDAIEKFFPPDIRFTRPSGGLFLWVELPEGLDSRKLLELSLKEDVAFVPGGAFFANGGHENTMRLNFSAMPEDRITEGIRRLGRVLAEVLEPAVAGV